MKKTLSDSLKKSVFAEKEAIKAKNYSIDERIAKAEVLFNPAKEKKQPSPTKPKEKVIKDTFTIPESDYSLLEKSKNRAITHHHVMNKSEIVRAGLILLSSLSDDAFSKAISTVKKIKTGRPKA